MKLDRELQLRILRRLAEHYPNPVPKLQNELDGPMDAFEANFFYLHEHGLVKCSFFKATDKHARSSSHSITALGMDYLEQDGGLTAILGTVTVRLHEETIKALLVEKLERSDLSEEEKRPLLQAVRALPAEATKHLTMKLLDLGADNLPRAIELVRSLMS